MGMNRYRMSFSAIVSGVPHARGDEPINDAVELRECAVFPTPVGMNSQLRVLQEEVSLV